MKIHWKADGPDCSEPGCCKQDRREFLKTVGLGAAAAVAAGGRVMADPANPAEFEKLVPADKKLDAEWLKSLFARGARTVYRGAELDKIGMPVGGICSGQVYLGGEGRLWYWDVFNKHVGTGAEHYAKPMTPTAPLDQGFALLLTAGGKTQARALDKSGWRDVSFNGEYPLAFIEYRDAESPAVVTLEAFSPFLPLNAEDSALPATVLRFTVKNTSAEKIEAELAGWLENAICLHSAAVREGLRSNRVVRGAGFAAVECSAADMPADQRTTRRPDIVFENFEKETYEGWTVTGTAFGSGPILIEKIPQYQGDVGGVGKRVVNSHASAPANDVGARDDATGSLTSKPFSVERNYITLLVGGGAHKGKTCVNVLVDDKVVLSATGAGDNKMRPHSFDVRQWMGKTAKIQIVDEQKGAWGNIGVDDIIFSDAPRGGAGPIADEADFGTMCLALLNAQPDDLAAAALPDSRVPTGLFSKPAAADAAATKPFGQKLAGSLTRKLSLAPGQEATATFVIAWHFPNLKLKDGGRFYATRFNSASAVVEHVAKNAEPFYNQTRLWHDTWYDSTLPYWFLDRTFLNTSILASSTCFWFKTGRFYAWEGVGCCEGTCTHVWHYAHAVARIFPQLERDLRQRTDFGLAFLGDSGVIKFRGEAAGLAIDGQAGCILRTYREHQMSADAEFLKPLWPKVKLAMQCLMKKDNGSGILDGGQHNTLDTDWYGPVAWLSGLYVAALRACEEMGREVGDEAFAKECRAIADKGSKAIVEQLFNGEYFINKPDPKKPDTINSGSGCHIDQVMGQLWAFHVGLGRVLPQKETLAALKSLWRYNFCPDVGPWRAAYKPGRWYAMPGEAGLLMCTFPQADWNYNKAKGKGPDWAAGYFNECMNGFEYQVASHMVWEGMVQEGLAITRAVHDRYHAARRNPWNEVECGDHYARSMASYGVFLAACGYEYHGPKGHLGFAPRLTPEDFRAPFTVAEGWGTFSQKRDGGTQREVVELKSGKLRVKTLAFALPENAKAAKVAVTVAGKEAPAEFAQDGARVVVTLAQDATITAGQKIELSIA